MFKLKPHTPQRHVYHHLVTHTFPHREARTVTDVVTFHMVNGKLVPDERHRVKGAAHLIQVCPLKLKEHECAIISGFDLVYALNDFDVFLEFCVEPMFQVHPEADYTPEDYVVETPEGEKHPDETGTPQFVVPARRYDGVIHPDERCIYRPRYMDLGFNVPAYIGLETHILNARSTCVVQQGVTFSQEYEPFMPTDPFAVYLMQNRHLFAELRDDDICLSQTSGEGESDIYLIRKTLVERVKDFFREALFPLFHYTRNDAVRFAWKTRPSIENTRCSHPVVTLMFQLDYIVVSPQIASVKMAKRDIKIV